MTGTTATTDAPLVAPTRTSGAAARAVVRVLTVGDGVMFDLEPAVAAAFGDDTVTTPRAYFGMALSRPEQFDWRTAWRDELATIRPDVVVVLLGVWDARTVTGGDRTYEPGTTDFFQWYSGVVGDAVELLTSTGAAVVWVSTLAEPDGAKNRAIAAVNTVARSVVARRPRARWVDGNVVLARQPDAYQRMVTAEDGTEVPLRKTDGEHLCAEGAARLAGAVRDAAGFYFDVHADEAWRTGSWRNDARYGRTDGCES